MDLAGGFDLLTGKVTLGRAATVQHHSRIAAKCKQFAGQFFWAAFISSLIAGAIQNQGVFGQANGRPPAHAVLGLVIGLLRVLYTVLDDG